MHCSNAAVNDTQLLLNDLDYWAQAVGGAGSCCDNVVLFWVIFSLQHDGSLASFSSQETALFKPASICAAR